MRRWLMTRIIIGVVLMPMLATAQWVPAEKALEDANLLRPLNAQECQAVDDALLFLDWLAYEYEEDGEFDLADEMNTWIARIGNKKAAGDIRVHLMPNDITFTLPGWTKPGPAPDGSPLHAKNDCPCRVTGLSGQGFKADGSGGLVYDAGEAGGFFSNHGLSGFLTSGNVGDAWLAAVLMHEMGHAFNDPNFDTSAPGLTDHDVKCYNLCNEVRAWTNTLALIDAIYLGTCLDTGSWDPLTWTELEAWIEWVLQDYQTQAANEGCNCG